MASSSSPSTTETRVDPRLVPFIEQGLGAAQNLFQTGQLQYQDPATGEMRAGYVPEYFGGQTFVGPSAYTQQALEMAAQSAQGVSPLVRQAQQSAQNIAAGQGPEAMTASGGYLGMNPFLQGTFESAARPITSQFQQQIQNINSQASRAGRFGSAAQGQLQAGAAESLAANLSGLGERLGFAGYQQERGLQEQALGRQQQGMLQAAQLAPTLANQDYLAAQRLFGVGQLGEQYQQQALQDQINRFNYQQQAPFRALQQYLSFIGGVPAGQQQVAPEYTNPAATALGGAALVSAFNQPRTNLGMTAQGT
jgi:hypothetical protein